jgi:hypothetical protein
MFSRWPHALVLLTAAGLGCRGATDTGSGPASAGPAWFEDVTQARGLDFVHDAGPTGSFFMPQVMGSGGALFDCDGDGRLDVYLVQNAGPDSGARNRLYRQQRDGTFRDASAGSGLDVAGYGMGVAVGDVDNDGRPDVLLTEYGGVRLFRNEGDGTFRDLTREAGLDNPSWGTSAAFLDYDRDGWLDLVVVNYVDYDPSPRCGNVAGWPDFCHPSLFRGTVTRLFRNLGAAAGPAPVRFANVTIKAGLAARPGPGLGVLCHDFDGDGRPDVFVANDSKANHLWASQGDGTFKEEAARRGLAYNAVGRAEANMGVALGDFDDDGLPDLFVTHLGDETHTLWKQGPRGQYQDRTVLAGIAAARRGTGFGTALADFDHDGLADLAVVNGRVTRRPGEEADAEDFWSRYAERNQLFANEGGRFREISDANPPLCGTPAVSRGLAVGDVDDDGALDLLVTAVAGPARLYRNVAPERGNWLLVRAVEGKRDAYGAAVTVRSGDRSWVGRVNPGYSYLTSSDPRAHFGLGATERVDSIHVLWPDGAEETFPGPRVNQVVELRKGTGTRAEGR